MDEEATAIALGQQLAIAGGLVLVMTVIHSVGLHGVGKFLHLEPEALKRRSFDARAIVLMAGLGLLLFALHFLEIVLFALFYMAIGAIDELPHALFYSASAYTTLGLAYASFPNEWRLIGSFEALIGFILIGWSTAFAVTTMNRLRES